MNPELETLARRAVACKHWRWMPGMKALDGYRVLTSKDDGYNFSSVDIDGYQDLATDWSTPDLSDPATVGCLLALVREAWDSPRISPVGTVLGWVVYTPGDRYNHDAYGATEAAALVAALEGAP